MHPADCQKLRSAIAPLRFWQHLVRSLGACTYQDKHKMSNEDFEVESNKIREENGGLLTGFAEWLLESDLKEKTIRKHVQNVDFYVNHYLLYDDCTPAKDGISSLNGFFNWFFPRKAMWSSASSTKETVASLKKFYKCLTEKNIVGVSDYQFLLALIKQDMPEWLEHYRDECQW